jgi:hypothetical protein
MKMSEFNMNEPFSGWEKQDFIKRIDELQDMNYGLYKEVMAYERSTVHNLIIEQIVKNPRGAGRKPILTNELREQIMFYHQQGVSIRMIIHYINVFHKKKLSIGLVHKAVKTRLPAVTLEDQLELRDDATVGA